MIRADLYLREGEDDELDLNVILTNNDWHGIHKYVKQYGVNDFTVGTKVLTTYTEPLGVNVGVTYDLPAILVDKSTAITQNGKTVPALYFMSQYAIPCTGIHSNNDNAGLMFDNAESLNSDANRSNSGNNRYLYSAIRQWLNGTDINWWVKQHAVDIEPNYTNRIGFLSCISSSLVVELQPIKIQVHTTRVDNSIIDVMYDSVFLPSLEEINRISLVSSYIADSGIEGHTWQYWKDKLGSTKRVDDRANSKAIIYGLDNHSEAEYIWLRSAIRIYSNLVLEIESNGYLSSPSANVSYNRVTPCWTILGI